MIQVLIFLLLDGDCERRINISLSVTIKTISEIVRTYIVNGCISEWIE